MKRYNNLYSNIWNISNIFKSYNEVSKNTRNKVRVSKLKAYKLVYVSKVNYTLKKKQYVTGPYNHFVIYEPKKRNIVSQQVEDKIVNHLVSRYILYPAILPCLLDVNVASRKDMGTSEGLRLAKDYHRKCKIKLIEKYNIKMQLFKLIILIFVD